MKSTLWLNRKSVTDKITFEQTELTYKSNLLYFSIFFEDNAHIINKFCSVGDLTNILEADTHIHSEQKVVDHTNRIPSGIRPTRLDARLEAAW